MKFIKGLKPCSALPEGSTFLSVEHFGTSAWTITGRVMAQNPDGTQSEYFLKAGSQMRQIYFVLHLTYSLTDRWHSAITA